MDNELICRAYGVLHGGSGEEKWRAVLRTCCFILILSFLPGKCLLSLPLIRINMARIEVYKGCVTQARKMFREQNKMSCDKDVIMVMKRLGGKYFLYREKVTPEKRRRRTLFAEAQVFAKEQMADAECKKYWQKYAQEHGIGVAYRAAVSFYMKRARSCEEARTNNKKIKQFLKKDATSTVISAGVSERHDSAVSIGSRCGCHGYRGDVECMEDNVVGHGWKLAGQHDDVLFRISWKLGSDSEVGEDRARGGTKVHAARAEMGSVVRFAGVDAGCWGHIGAMHGFGAVRCA